jgi:alpha-D-xyloside xylohydrolase
MFFISMVSGCAQFEWTSFEWNQRVFPDPAGMLQRLHARGLKICVWINPYIAQRSRIFDEGATRGYFIKRIDGSIWQTDVWQPDLAIVDFTNQAARE